MRSFLCAPPEVCYSNHMILHDILIDDDNELSSGVTNTPTRVHFGSTQVHTFPSTADLLRAVAICPACRSHKAANDPSHTRIEGECRSSHLEPETWECPGCRHRAAADSDEHTLVPGECRVGTGDGIRRRNIGSTAATSRAATGAASGVSSPRGLAVYSSTGPDSHAYYYYGSTHEDQAFQAARLAFPPIIRARIHIQMHSSAYG